MSLSSPGGDREKVVSKIPVALQLDLKIRAAQHGIDIQHAVEAGIEAWRGLGSNLAPIDTSGAKSFATFLPAGQWDSFRGDCASRGVSIVQGLAQSVQMWLETNPAPTVVRPEHPKRVVVCNQKGGVGKTAITAGTGEALAEDANQLHPVRISKHFAAALSEDDGDSPLNYEDLPGLGMRVLLVDFDPQCHLTKQLGQEPLPLEGDSLTKHMAGESKGQLRDLIVPIEDARFGDRLHLLPACTDAFLLDVKLSGVRAREAALERALSAVEDRV